MRREVCMIFQDPFGSLNPRMTIAQVIGEPLLINGMAKGSELDDRITHFMRQVGLDPDWRERYPHALSGGQRQRIAIARARTKSPRHRRGRGDLGARRVAALSGARSASGAAGRARSRLHLYQPRHRCHPLHVRPRRHDVSRPPVEVGEAEGVCEAPRQDYTRALISAMPRPDPRRRSIHNRIRYTEPSTPVRSLAQ
jgi:peptide/nickel transport system ATP-binding protein